MQQVFSHNGQHVIRRNHSIDYPHRILVIDTETKQSPAGDYTHHEFLISWSAFYLLSGSSRIVQEDWKLWNSSKDLCNYIVGKCYAKAPLYIYAHNAFFDLMIAGFFYHLPKMGWQYDWCYDSGLTFILSVKFGSKKIKCISTTNYYGFTLKALGKHIGLPKLDVDFKKSSLDEIKTYCRRDVEIAVKALFEYMSFNHLHDTGKFALTRSSQAFNAYRHRFMSTSIYIHSEESVIDLERSAYFGGRVEAFQIGTIKEGPFTFMDVNSMYPFVMRNNLYPTKLIGYNTNLSLDTFSKWYLKACYIAEVDIEVTDPIFAKRINGKLMFPVGRIHTYLTTAGLNMCYEKGWLKAIHRIAFYERGSIFTDYIDYFYPLKAKYKSEENKIYTSIVKLFLNGLYGKFGQKETTEIVEDTPEIKGVRRIENYDMVTGENWVEFSMFGKTISQYGAHNGKNSLVAIAAHVTENARLVLWNIINTTGTERVLYCDTDSIAVRSKDLSHISYPIDNSLLGSISVAKTGFQLVVSGAKDYQLDDEIKIKGIPKAAQQTGINSWNYTQFLGMATHMRMGIDQGFRTVMRNKTLDRIYDKGNVGKLGKVSPFILTDF